ncbi:MAG: serine/threonine-protein kinase, partial [Myxococcota bacterium]
LDHPNIVRTTDAGVEGQYPFIVMEYLEGQSLARVLHELRREKFSLPLHLRILILNEVLSALDYAHNLGDYDGTPLEIVHRDVTPGNVLITYRGEVKLVDFGIAKATLRTGNTAVGVIKGKANYMSPEQLSGDSLGPESDLFAVGVLLFELVTLRSPWGGEEVNTKDRPPPALLRDAMPTAPDELVAICDRALHIDPRRRYGAAVEMRNDLEGFLAREGFMASRRELGLRMNKQFAADRERVKKVLRQRLVQVREVVDGPYEEESYAGEDYAVDEEKAPTRADIDIADLPRAPQTLPSSMPPEPTSVSLRPEEKRERRRRRPASPRKGWDQPILLTAIGITLALVAFSAGSYWSRSQSSRSAPPVYTPPGPVPLPPPVVAPVPQMQLTVKARPSHASLFIDGRPVPGNPFVTHVSADGLVHVLRAEAPGYQPVEQRVIFRENQLVELDLTPAP